MQRERRNRVGAAALVGLAILGGCGPAEIVPQTPPGVPFRRTASESMEAEGESKSKGAILPASAGPEGKAAEAPTTKQP